jgi:hypothetical protein
VRKLRMHHLSLADISIIVVTEIARRTESNFAGLHNAAALNSQ